MDNISKTKIAAKGRDYACIKCHGTIQLSKGKSTCYACGWRRPSAEKSPETERDIEYKKALRKSFNLR